MLSWTPQLDKRIYTYNKSNVIEAATWLPECLEPEFA